MNSNQLFKKYYSRLALEGLIKALICGFIAGFIVSLILSIISYIVNFQALFGILIAVGALLAVAAAVTPLFYRAFFRPNTKQIARRIDRLGLDERLITMMELQEDESYIAMRQREDAKEKLKTVNRKQLNFSIFIIPVVLLLVLAVSSISMITVAALNVIPKMDWSPRDPDAQAKYEYVKVSYVVADGGGYILGETEQLVRYGQDASTVTAIPEEGYMFSRWSDEKVRTPVRTDEKIVEELIIYVYFTIPEEPPEEESSDSSFVHTEANTVKDGQKHYLDIYDSEGYYAAAMESLANGEISDEHRAIVEGYLNAIK